MQLREISYYLELEQQKLAALQSNLEITNVQVQVTKREIEEMTQVATQLNISLWICLSEKSNISKILKYEKQMKNNTKAPEKIQDENGQKIIQPVREIEEMTQVATQLNISLRICLSEKSNFSKILEYEKQMKNNTKAPEKNQDENSQKIIQLQREIQVTKRDIEEMTQVATQLNISLWICLSEKSNISKILESEKQMKNNTKEPEKNLENAQKIIQPEPVFPLFPSDYQNNTKTRFEESLFEKRYIIRKVRYGPIYYSLCHEFLENDCQANRESYIRFFITVF